MGCVEEASLEEEDEGDPLVVGLVLHLPDQKFVSWLKNTKNSHMVVFILASSNTGVDGVLEVVGQGEGAHDVTVGVHHTGRNRPVVRVSGLGGNTWPWLEILHLDAADEGVIANILDATDKKATALFLEVKKLHSRKQKGEI